MVNGKCQLVKNTFIIDKALTELEIYNNNSICSIFLSTIWMQELNAPLASLLMIPNWEVLLTLLRDWRPYRGI